MSFANVTGAAVAVAAAAGVNQAPNPKILMAKTPPTGNLAFIMSPSLSAQRHSVKGYGSFPSEVRGAGIERSSRALHPGGPQNPLCGFAQRTDLDERPVRALFGVAVLDENGAATGAMAGFNITPTVAHDVTRFKIDVPDSGGFEQQAGLRLAAGTACGVV